MARLPGDADAIRGIVPAASEAWREIGDNVVRAGIVDQTLKELCYRHLTGDPDTMDPAHLEPRERAALQWVDAIAYDSARADDALWARLHELFSEPELVDLGCAIGFELGQQHWRRTLGLPARD